MTNYDQPSSIFSRKKHHNDPLSQKEIHYHSQQLRKLLQTTCNQPLLTSTNIWEPTLSNTMSVTTHYHLQGLTTTKNKNHNHHMQDQYYKTICNDPIAPRNLRQHVYHPLLLPSATQKMPQQLSITNNLFNETHLAAVSGVSN